MHRAVDAECARSLETLEASGALRRLVDEGLLVGTRFVDDETAARLAAAHPGYARFLEHDRIRPITYPYCWSVSMLADAAALTLDLQMRLLETGHSLKDATAYNVQFVRGRPVFIDLSSIERPPRLDIWIAMGQFQQMFTFPLMLLRDRGWDLRSYFLASLGGRTVEQVARAYPGLARWRPGRLLDLTLPLLLNRRSGGDGAGPGREILEKKNPDSRAQVINLRRLRNKVRKLAAGYRPEGTWSRYTQECGHYGDDATAAKKDLVRRMLQEVRPAEVLDLGCNTGEFSFLAVECGAVVVAADGDPDAVEILYRRVRQARAPIAPMVLDLCNPSPAIGFRNRERPSFLERVRADAVLALALLHHLHVSGNLPLEAVRDLFCDLTRDALVLEFVPPADPMFRRLTRFRRESFDSLTLERCIEAFRPRFDLVRQDPVPGTPRTLLLFRRRERAA